MAMTRFVILLLFLHCVGLCMAETYSSVALLKDQFTRIKHDKVRAVIKDLIVEQEERLDTIKSLAKTLGDLSGDEIRDPNFTVHHPLNAFRFIRNHSVIFNTTATQMLDEIHLYEKGRAKIAELAKNIQTVRKEDFEGILHGIILIQNTYNLTTSDMADGNFQGVKSEPLTAAECGDVMLTAFKERYYSLGYEWFTAAVDKCVAGDETTSPILLLMKAAATVASIGDPNEAIALYSKVVYLDPKSRYHKYRLKLYMKKMKHADKQQKINYYNKKPDPLRLKHNSGCQGNIPRLLGPLTKEHYCDYDDNSHPLLLIQPAKREIISLDPYVVVYHNVIGKRTMSKLKGVAKSQLRRSLVKAKKGNIPDPQRTSQSYFMSPNKDILKLYNTIEAMTSLNRLTYEHLQVANYGIGGHYYCHHDFFPDNHYNDDTHDNRLATFMIYMSDVKAGGGTVFPEISEVVFPQMGSAVFWYNMYPNSTLHHSTRHAACPVLVGDKWVGNVWIRRNGNEFRKPCHLDQYSKYWM